MKTTTKFNIQQLEQEMTQKYTVLMSVSPNIIVDIERCSIKELDVIQQRLGKDDFIFTFDYPTIINYYEFKKAVFIFGVVNPIKHLNLKTIMLKFPQQPFGSGPFESTQLQQLNRMILMLQFPKIGLSLSNFVKQVVLLQDIHINYVALIDFECYDRQFVSEVAIVILSNNVVVKTYHKIVNFDGSNLPQCNLQSLGYVRAKVTGLNWQVPNGEDWTIVKTDIQNIINEYTPTILAKGGTMEQSMLSDIMGQKITVYEVYPYVWLKSRQIDEFDLETERKNGTKCQKHQSMNPKYHCALQDVQMFVKKITSMK